MHSHREDAEHDTVFDTGVLATNCGCDDGQAHNRMIVALDVTDAQSDCRAHNGEGQSGRGTARGPSGQTT
ncbi:MAG: hypothetical protein IPO31_15255 [Candidatus Obscuribacter sp.]|nr:hypothetical protein [Candidatus Obscuribacter sp.]